MLHQIMQLKSINVTKKTSKDHKKSSSVTENVAYPLVMRNHGGGATNNDMCGVKKAQYRIITYNKIIIPFCAFLLT